MCRPLLFKPRPKVDLQNIVSMTICAYLFFSPSVIAQQTLNSTANGGPLGTLQGPAGFGLAVGDNSTSIGSGSRAVGDNSTSIGSGSSAAGLDSSAYGFSNASGNFSSAYGSFSNASGESGSAYGVPQVTRAQLLVLAASRQPAKVQPMGSPAAHQEPAAQRSVPAVARQRSRVWH
jgi:hypothetical protein